MPKIDTAMLPKKEAMDLRARYHARIKPMIRSFDVVSGGDIRQLRLARAEGGHPEVFFFPEYATGMPLEAVHFFVAETGAEIGEGTPLRARYDAYLVTRAEWMKKHGVPPPVPFESKEPPRWLPVKCYAAVFEVLHCVEKCGVSAPAMSLAATLLFRTEDRVARYMESWADRVRTQPLHDILHMIRTPQDNLRGIDFKAWGDAALQHGPAMVKLFTFADKFAAPLKSEDGKTWSLVRTREAVSRFVYANGGKNPALAALFNFHAKTEADFDRALALVAAREKNNVRSSLPSVNIDGAAFDMPGAVFKSLDDGDPRGLILGALTDCCQSVGSEGAECAEHGFSSPNGKFYVIASKGRGRKDEEIIGQAWGWRGRKNELVLDTLETLGTRVTDAQWTGAVRGLAQAIAENVRDITALHVGLGGDTPENLPFPKTNEPALPIDYSGYRESHDQKVIWIKM